MYKTMTPGTKAATSKTKNSKTLKKEVKNGQHGLINSLHKWGEDYYGAEDYYEKPVKITSKKNYYNDFQKKSR